MNSSIDHHLSSSLFQTLPPQLFEQTISACSLGIVIADAQQFDFPAVYVNPAFEKQTGYSAAEVIGQNLRFLRKDDRDQPGLEAVRIALKTGNRATTLLRNCRKDDSLYWCELTVFPVWNAGEITHFVGIHTDVSDRIQSEQEHQKREADLKKSHQLLTQVIDEIPMSIFWKDRNSVYLGCNTTFAKAAGVGTPDQIVGKTDHDLAWAIEEAEEYRKNDDRIMQSRIAEANLIEKQTQADGRLIWTETSKIPLIDNKGNVFGVLGAFKDISVRKAAEEALREREAELRNITSLVPGVLYQYRFNLQTKQGCFTYISSRCSEVFEIEPEAVQNSDETLWRMVHPDDLAELQNSVVKAVCKHKAWTDEFRMITPSGKEKWIRGESQSGDVTEAYSLHYGIFFDISDRKAIELQLQRQTQDLEQTLKDLQRTQTHLIQSERMSSLGQLVAGVAHEINNPVNFISGNVTHAQQYVLDLFRLLDTYEQECGNSINSISQITQEIDLEFVKADLPNLLASMRTGVDRIRQIVLSLRLFSRLDEAEYKEANLHEAIDSTLMLLDHRLQTAKIRVTREYNASPIVECYAGQLNQVFLNIIENAIHALQTQQARILSIRTESIEEQFVRIVISDNGIGMTQEIQQRIFDPFFTTKEVGQGTGMGLAISYQIVSEQHHGSLRCESRAGEGATFTIEIPTKLKSFT